jgi:hypothetical protein
VVLVYCKEDEYESSVSMSSSQPRLRSLSIDGTKHPSVSILFSSYTEALSMVSSPLFGLKVPYSSNMRPFNSHQQHVKTMTRRACIPFPSKSRLLCNFERRGEASLVDIRDACYFTPVQFGSDRCHERGIEMYAIGLSQKSPLRCELSEPLAMSVRRRSVS